MRDERTIISLLPGKLIARKLLEEELETIKGIILNGAHKEYMALVPGLEIEIDRIKHELEMITAMQALTVPNGHRAEIIEAKQIEAPGPSPADKYIPENRRTRGGKLTISYVILDAVLRAGGEIAKRDFVRRWQAEYPAVATGIFAQTCRFIDRYGVYVRVCQDGMVRIIDGKPKKFQKVSAKTLTVREAIRIADSIAKPKPQKRGPKPGGGSRADILRQEYEISDTLNYRELEEKHNVGRLTFHWAAAVLRKRGWRFKQTGIAAYKVIKKGG